MTVELVSQAKNVFPRARSNKELRKLLKGKFGISGRRLDNFTLSGMLAVAEIREDFSQFDKISLFSISNYFSVELLQDMLIGLSKNESVKPLDFIATVGNAANYYIAKEFNLLGTNIFAALENNGLEKIKTLASMELKEKRSDAALIVRWLEEEDQRTCEAWLYT